MKISLLTVILGATKSHQRGMAPELTVLVVTCYSRTRAIRAFSSNMYLVLINFISLDPLHEMQEALDYKAQHPSESYAKLSARFGVPATTIRNRLCGTHAPRGERMPRRLSTSQEGILIDTINNYAERGTLLTPKHIHQLAKCICGEDIGQNWTSTFLWRHKDEVSTRFYRVQELARLKANTPEMCGAFLTLVSLPERIHLRF